MRFWLTLKKRASEDKSEFLIINLLSEKSSRRSVLTTASMSAAQYELTIELIFFAFGDRIIVPETTLSSRKFFLLLAPLIRRRAMKSSCFCKER